MSEATKLILEQITKLSERMQATEDNSITQEERQDFLAKMEELNTKLLEARAAGTQQVMTVGSNGKEFNRTEVRNALDTYLRGTDFNDMDVETRTSLSNIQDNEGGFLLKETMESEVLMNAFNPGEIESIVPVLPTGGNRAVIPSMAKPKVAWGPKNITLTDQELAAGNVGIDIHKIRALVVIPRDTLEDSAADIVGELNAAFGRALEEARDDAYAVGTGVNMPQGFMTNSQVLANTNQVAVAGFDVDVIIKAIYALKKTYRRNAAIACNSVTEGTMATFKGSDGHPLWRVGSVDGAPNTFMNLPIINPEAMDDADAAGKFPIAVADFAAGYRIRERG